MYITVTPPKPKTGTPAQGRAQKLSVSAPFWRPTEDLTPTAIADGDVARPPQTSGCPAPAIRRTNEISHHA